LAGNKDVIAIYSRKSRFTGKGESVANQIEMCKSYIRNHYGTSYAENAAVFEDEGFSGKNMERPGFKEMMKLAEKRQIRAIVVYRLDRISRNIGDFANLIQVLNSLGVDFVSVTENFSTDSPMGRAMMYIASVFSQLERETIAERIRDNMHELAKTGRWLGGVTPTGYASESVATVTMDGKQHKACKLTMIPEEAEIVKMIFDLFHEYDSLTKVEAELMRRQIKSKRGNDFTRFSIKGILQNPVYLIADHAAYQYFMEQGASLFSDVSEFDGTHGVMAYNRTDQTQGKNTVYLPIDKWIVSVGAHQGLIPSGLWLGAQKSLERNRSKGYRKPRSNTALLTGLLYCSCGARMYPKLTNRTTPDGEKVYTYVCSVKERSKKSQCNSKNLNGNLLDRMIVDEIRKLSESDSELVKQLEGSRKYFTGDREIYEKGLDELRKQQEETERKTTALVDSIADLQGSAAIAAVSRRIEELQLEQKQIADRIREMEGLAEAHVLEHSEFQFMLEQLSSFRNSVDIMSVEQKRTAIRMLVRRVVWDGASAHVVLFGAPDEAELPPFSNAESDFEEEDACLGKILPPSASKTHWGEDRIFDASAGIGRKAHILVRAIGVHALNEPDRADRDQVIRFAPARIIFLDDMRYQP
jgi:site-specific DNA recombinase